MKVAEFAQIIDAYPAPDRTHWYELWSLDQQDRFMLRLKGSAKLTVGQIIRIDRRKKPKDITALQFTKLPERLAKRTVVKARSFTPKTTAKLVPQKPSSTKVEDAPPGTALFKVYEGDAVSEALV